ncbi:cyclophilin-like fold protein [Mucilaginibacter sp. KACC 22773]|uniref:cyclophilin-like fold protein n=1 Tax=Mucilaginibacter sp. KACC 22773 TaxID=3025671 RepID=UPI002367378E|nr:cyclophilin-like fold protein [Mucilaginibacter sp. KACC 22773]WDF77217.1 cyclophilin-like fold protein [Mucilaginibacter sp. KACC 22773]
MHTSANQKISITIGGKVITGTLYDNAATRDFISLLPLTLTLKDYAGKEKISYLPKKLSTQNVPEGSDPSIGAITYYAPWGNLAIFYKDFTYSSDLVKLGKIDSGMEILKASDGLQARFELVR